MTISSTEKTKILCTTIIGAICAILWNKIFLIAPIIFILTILGLHKKIIKPIFALIIICLFIISTLYTISREPKEDKLIYYDNKNITLNGTIVSLPESNQKEQIIFDFDVNEITDTNGNNKKIKAKTKVFLNKPTKINRGDNLKISAYIIVPTSYNNPGEFNYGKYLANYNIFTLAFANDIEIYDTEPNLKLKVLKFLDNIRSKIITKHEKYLDDDKVKILGGVVFGSEAIKPSPDLKNIFLNSGLYHLLAASGMNVAFIFGIWFFILNKLKIPYKIIIISGGFVVIIYALMTGLPPSVTRATWMLELALFGKLIDRNSDNNIILLFVCAILLIYNPLMLNDIGFLLSFVVAFGLINCAVPLIESIKFIPARISGWIIIPFIAQIFASPIQMYYFHTFSLYAVLANMLVIPFTALISFCGFIASIVAPLFKIGDFLCFVLDKINEPFLKFLIFIAQTISNLPNNTIPIAKLEYFEIIIYYALIMLLTYTIKLNFKNTKLNILTLIISLLLISNITYKTLNKNLEITFLNVGEADSIVIKTPHKKTILIDTGTTYNKTQNSGNKIILPYLKTNGISQIDLMILTHPDNDHIGGSVSILENMPVNKIITNGEKANNLTYKDFKKFLTANKIQENQITTPTEISTEEELSLIAIKPKNINFKNQNDTSLIVLLKYKDFDAIFMGDNETNNFDILKKNLNPTGKIEIFKVGHHGSKKSINKTMADFLNPQISIISVGENAYGHPHPKTLSHLKKSKIFRTDKDNAIKIKTNGKKYSIYTYNSKTSNWDKK